ncbi:MAG: hypothetical protein KGI03_00860 [Patescibacteria group bacterium]|nr:hypothetical protein [Patescibacteria group bacterium]
MQTALTDKQRELAIKLLRLFKIDGKPADQVATAGQVELFGRLVFKVSLRQHIQCLTQYGKSLFTALACIVLTGIDPDQGEHVKVVAPTDEKAHIIMRYYTSHIGDSPLFAPLLSPDTKLERLMQETTKDSLILKNGGIMQVFTVNAGNSQRGFEAAMGQSGDVVILDEACLVPDRIEATIIRMLAGRPDGMYVKIGNPFYSRTHFQKSFRDPGYLNLVIDYHQALKEGRITQSFIDEVREKPFFDVLYECKFPSDKQIDTKGYHALYTETLLDISYLDSPLPFIGEKHIGVDVSHGGDNYSTIVLRGANQAKLLFKQQTEDELILLTEVERIAKANGVPLSDRFIHFDKTGSAALCSRANELWPVYDGRQNQFGVTVGERADPEKMQNGETAFDEKTGKPVILFINKRAQLAWRGHEWVQRGGKLWPRTEFDDLLTLRYKIQSDKKIKLKSKDEMAEEGIPSPDCADALNLTFDQRLAPSTGRVDYAPQHEDAMTSFGV